MKKPGKPDSGAEGLDRRRFLQAAAAGAGAAMVGATEAIGAETSERPRQEPRRAPWVRTRQVPDFAIVGAGAFGAWTAVHLQEAGAQVTLLDQYGPANSRATSGGETRGVRTSYGNEAHGLLWADWGKRAIEMWKAWDERWQDMLLPRVFFTTSDLMMRYEWSEILEDTKNNWEAVGTEYEILTPDEIRHRWPVIDLTDIGVALYEPNAGVVRARRAIESVAQVFQHAGGDLQLSMARLGSRNGRQLNELALDPTDTLSAGTYVFALGPWFPKAFPEVMGKRLRIGMGNVYYFRTPPGDNRYTYPNLPSYNFSGVTGWPALGPDNRGFRVRTGGNDGPDDPDISQRWIDPEMHVRPRQVLRDRFPGLADAPVSETRACHYESSVDSNFFFDFHPDFDNVWFAGGGSAEGFKFGPMIGQYLSGRLLGTETDPELIETFRLKEEEFENDDEWGG